MPRDVHPTPFVIHPSDELAKNIDLKNLGVAKVVGLQSPLHELDNLENAAYKVVCC